MHALGPGANTDTKLLICCLFQKGRILAQDGEPISEMADAGIVLLRPFLRRVDLFTGTKRRIERHRDRL